MTAFNHAEFVMQAGVVATSQNSALPGLKVKSNSGTNWLRTALKIEP